MRLPKKIERMQVDVLNSACLSGYNAGLETVKILVNECKRLLDYFNLPLDPEKVLKKYIV